MAGFAALHLPYKSELIPAIVPALSQGLTT